MKKTCKFIISTLLILTMSFSVYAQDSATMFVTATVENNNGLYRSVVINKTELSSFITDVTIKSISESIATKDEQKFVTEDNKTLTLTTTVTPLSYSEIEKENPEIKINNAQFKNVMSMDISLTKTLSNDKQGEDVISKENITELTTPLTMEFNAPKYDKETYYIKEYAMTRIHNQKSEPINITYNKEKDKFVFTSDKFSTYLLYYSLDVVNKQEKTSSSTKKTSSSSKVIQGNTEDMVTLSFYNYDQKLVKSFYVKRNTFVNAPYVPQTITIDGTVFSFVGWNPTFNGRALNDASYTAQYALKEDSSYKSAPERVVKTITEDDIDIETEPEDDNITITPLDDEEDEDDESADEIKFSNGSNDLILNKTTGTIKTENDEPAIVPGTTEITDDNEPTPFPWWIIIVALIVICIIIIIIAYKKKRDSEYEE